MKTPVARAPALIGAVALLCLSGCANLSGLDGTSSYGCKAPEGVKCDSVSGTYYNAIQNNLPSQRRSAPSGQSELPPAAGPAGGLALPGDGEAVDQRRRQGHQAGLQQLTQRRRDGGLVADGADGA